jgi:hypothetical protein
VEEDLKNLGFQLRTTITSALKTKNFKIGVNFAESSEFADLMNQYIEYVGDILLIQLGYEKIYKGQNPFPFMDAINLSNKTNFFEHRTTQYQKANLTTNNLELSDDF